LKKDLDGFIESSQERVTGQVRLKLYKGGLRVVGRQSNYSLYNMNLATYGSETTFDQNLAHGFIENGEFTYDFYSEPIRTAFMTLHLSKDRQAPGYSKPSFAQHP
jgi:argininosuccinate synthase